ncbi:MAG: DEAD/DEAH box helicase, partial [Thermomicrobiales bacterium]|nr:DEAD/DEAH box helicase [Thermomicrobiales bacterium]
MTTFTDYHSKFLAYELTRRHAADSSEKFAGTLVDAQVDANPHQIDAALFAFKSPLATGALLADEVGLGKTIEAGLVISQRWAERKRKILIVVPASLRKQWLQEMADKFFLPCVILETKFYNQARRAGTLAPFESDKIVICSYEFARRKAADIANIPWDLVVLDEAHRLRNVYKSGNVIARAIKDALQSTPKLLLTATPLQNSLNELYGLVSLIDEYTFGDLESFRIQFGTLQSDRDFQRLRDRIKPICHRTLRKQVLPYIKYTKRQPLLEEFTPGEYEDLLYDAVSEYLRRDNLKALPNSQRALITMVLRKLLASSTFAIASALDTMASRLRTQLGKQGAPDLGRVIAEDYETYDEAEEEDDVENDGGPDFLSEADRRAIETELRDLDDFINLARSIDDNAKGKALLVGLRRALQQAEELGAARKAIIFTESRKTQDYIQRLLLSNPEFSDGIVLFNGSNNDEQSRAIYHAWVKRHTGTDKVTGSKSADMRSALVEEFRDRGQIMIATESAAEGINLQFCSLVVNYDLPWNPQRIEQ